MIRIVSCTTAALLLVLGSATGASGQILNSPTVGEEVAAVSLKLGLLAPRTSFDDPIGGQSSFDNGLALGFSATAWPMFDNRLGLRVNVIRSETDGQNTMYDQAPMALNDPTVYFYTAELVYRMPLGGGYPYLSAGYGGKHYTWAISAHKASKFAAFTGAAGYEMRPAAMGPFGINAELRGYRSNFRAFGIDDGSWEFGPYGGNVGGVSNFEILFTTGVSLYF